MNLTHARRVFLFQNGLIELMLPLKEIGNWPMQRPFANANHPLWIVGHLAVTADRVAGMLSGDATTLDTWRDRFGIGSEVLDDAAAYPPFHEVHGAWQAANQRLADAAGAVDASVLERPFPLPDSPLAEHLDSVGALAAFVMASHVPFHAGQLSMWRRARGASALF